MTRVYKSLPEEWARDKVVPSPDVEESLFCILVLVPVALSLRDVLGSRYPQQQRLLLASADCLYQCRIDP